MSTVDQRINADVQRIDQIVDREVPGAFSAALNATAHGWLPGGKWEALADLLAEASDCARRVAGEVCRG